MVKLENSSWLKDSTRAGSGIVSLAGCVVKSESKLLLSLSLSCNIENRASTVPRTYMQLQSKQFSIELYAII